VLDEAAMTDDAALLAFLEAARTTGTKVVMVGDHRQLSSVGPGGGFEALLRRFGGAVHVLSDNVRQRDPEEREALADLRSGDVDAAVAWYAAQGRITVSPDRDTALDATVAGWAADVADGAQVGMYAWKRANVAELNRRGREAWEAMRRLSGPELVVGDRGYRAGDRIVTLAPGADGAIVTCECGTVLAVDVARRELGVTMDDGRFQRFAGHDLDAAHLAHGYALTVHRSQGATVGRAHALEDGGGRELAYVKMSRARERTTLYAVADDLEQAVEDLRRCWSASRRIGWAIDRGVPSRDLPAVAAAKALDHTDAAHVRRARLVAERQALAAVIPPDRGFAFHRAEARVRQLTHRLEALDKADGWGELRGTPVGEAAIAWKQALGEWRGCLAQAEHAGLRERHQLRRRAAQAAEREGPLRDAFQALAAPERDRIRAELPDASRELKKLAGQQMGHRHFQIAHPEALRRLDRLDAEIATAAWEMDVDRQRLDGIPAQRPDQPALTRGMQREAPMMDRGIDLGL
jgi:hypothetical protein